jgi:hypothetical protein
LYRPDSRVHLLDQVKQRADEIRSELCRLVELAQSDDEADQGRDTLFRLGELLIRSVDIVNWVG